MKLKIFNDWFIAFAWLLILVSTILLCTYYFKDNVNSCTSDPMGYTIQMMKDKYDVDLVYGTIHIGKGNSYDSIPFGDVNITIGELP